MLRPTPMPLPRRTLRLVAALVLLPLVVALGGCATANAPAAWNTVPPEQKAVVFGSVTAATGSAGAYAINYTLRFRNIDTQDSASIVISPGLDLRGEPEFYVSGRRVGRLFEIALPAGRYEFYSLSMVSSRLAGGTSTFTARDPFSLPFTVAAGQLAYLGEYGGHPMVGRNVLGMSIPAGVYFVISDQQSRDLAILRARRGDAVSGTLANIVPDPSTANTPLLRRTPLPPFDTVPSS